MVVKRPIVGDPYLYRGRTVSARYLGPDLIAYVNDVELPHFYLDIEAVRGAGRRWVDAEEDERAKGKTNAQSRTRQPVR